MGRVSRRARSIFGLATAAQETVETLRDSFRAHPPSYASHDGPRESVPDVRSESPVETLWAKDLEKEAQDAEKGQGRLETQPAGSLEKEVAFEDGPRGPVVSSDDPDPASDENTI